jgi:hypothetical protein
MLYCIRYEAENIPCNAQNVRCCIRYATYNIICGTYDVAYDIVRLKDDIIHCYIERPDDTISYVNIVSQDVYVRYCTSKHMILYVYVGIIRYLRLARIQMFKLSTPCRASVKTFWRHPQIRA